MILTNVQYKSPASVLLVGIQHSDVLYYFDRSSEQGLPRKDYRTPAPYVPRFKRILEMMTFSPVESNSIAKPAIVLIPGAWFSQSTYEEFLEILGKARHATADGPYPSLNPKDPANADSAADIAFVRSNTLLPLIETEGKNFAIVMHSYEGAPGSAAERGLSKPTRQLKTRPGGVIGLVPHFWVHSSREVQALLTAKVDGCLHG